MRNVPWARCRLAGAAALPLLWSTSAWADDFTTSERYGGHLTDGFVFNNNRWGEPVDTGPMTIATHPDLFSYWTTHSANKQCCSAPYAGIGTIGGQGKEWTSDQYGQPGSHLPIMLADIEALKGSWRFKVPMPTSSQDQYHVYYEIYICDNTKGLRGKGNIAIGLWDNEFYHQSYKGGLYGTREDVNGYPMDVQFSANPFGQGDFWVVESPTGTYSPDANGVITVTGFDIKKVIDWGIAKGTYNPQHYLTELNLAFEVMTLPGKTLTTQHASFCVKSRGADAVATPTWTASQWGPACGEATIGNGDSDAGGVDASRAVGDASRGGEGAARGDADGVVADAGEAAVPAGEPAAVGPAANEGGSCGCRVTRAPSGKWALLGSLGWLALAATRRTSRGQPWFKRTD